MEKNLSLTIYLGNSWQCFQGNQIQRKITLNKMKINSLFHVKRKVQRESGR